MKRIIWLMGSKLRDAIEEACTEMGCLQVQSDITEMARVGFMEGSFEVKVNTNDSGDLPTFTLSKTQQNAMELLNISKPACV